MVNLLSDEKHRELLDIAEAVAREKGIKSEEVLRAMELAIQKASRAKYGHERDIQAKVDHKTGAISLFVCYEVVDQVTNESTQWALEQARVHQSDAQIGDTIRQPLPAIDLGRVAAGTARQVIFQEVREAERLHQYEEYKNRVGEIISGQVKRVDPGYILVALGQTEAILPKDQTIPREPFSVGDRVRAYITDVRKETRGAQIFLSRTHPQFMAKLFTQEVPEIYEGRIEIKGVARDPGSRAKMAVFCRDDSLDPVGACVGMRGSRVNVVVEELRGERVDIIPWSADVATFVVNALVPAEVQKVLIDEESERIEVVVPDAQLSLAIGRRGQNIRLASMLTGYYLDVISEKEASERRAYQMKEHLELFVNALDVDDVLAHLLIGEGFESIEEIAFVDLQELLRIGGIEEDLAQELQKRAGAYLARVEAELKDQVNAMQLDQNLVALEGMTLQMVVTLGKENIRTLSDFADLSRDELRDILPMLSIEEANQLVLTARAHCFGIKETNEEDKR